MDCFECIHIRKKHPLKQIFRCQDVKILVKHIHIKHPYISIYRCIFCPSATSSASVYKRHVQRHIDRQHVADFDVAIAQVPVHIAPEPVLHAPILEQVELLPPIEGDYDIPRNSADNVSNQTQVVIDLDEYIEQIKIGACRYVLKLLSNPEMTMKQALRSINAVYQFMTPIHNFIRLNIDYLPCNGNKEKFIELCKNPFADIRTEYKLIKFLKLRGLYSKPSKFILRTSTKQRTRKGKTILSLVDETVVIMSIKFMVKKFLELPGVYDKMSDKMRKLMEDNTNICNFVQGEKWRKIVNDNPERKLIPIFLYNDDFATGNQQGIKSANHGVSVVNIHFPLMEDWELSRLQFLFPIAFVKASYSKGGQKSKCFLKLRDVLKDLDENGLEINVNGQECTVHIILGTIIGDNLAVHQMLDLTTGFMHEYMCRVCLMDKNTRKIAVVENKELYRTKEHYEINKNNPRFGYMRNCPFNYIPNFHVICNFSADIMHDILEGVAIFGIQVAIDTLTREGFLTAAEFTNILDTFSYGEIDSNNKLSSDNFKNGKLYLTASQSILMIKYFPLLISHRVPLTNKTLKYTIILERMLNLCMSRKFDDAKLNQLSDLIKIHHTMYLKFKETKIDRVTQVSSLQFVSLKPKHHILLHYVYIIRQNGPLVHMWTMRHEGLNKYMKSYTNVNASRVHLSYSLAKKFQLIFANFIEDYSLQGKNIDVVFTTSKKFELHVKKYNGRIRFPFAAENITTSYNRIEFRGTEYKTGYFVHTADLTCEIIDIISTVNNNFFVVLEQYQHEEKLDLNYFYLGITTENFLIRSLNYLGTPFNIITLLNRRNIFKFNRHRISYM